MGKLEQITAVLHALPEVRRDEIAEIFEPLFHGDLHPENALSSDQIADLQLRAANPGVFASQADTEAYFACFRS